MGPLTVLLPQSLSFADTSCPVDSSRLLGLPAGETGVKFTVGKMREFTREGKKQPRIICWARSIVLPIEEKNWTAEVAAIFEFVQREIRYVRDVTDTETLQTPEQTLIQGCGDCDDQSTLLATLLEAIGHRTAFEAVAFKPGYPKIYSHVFVRTKLGRCWVALDATEQRPMGWEPPRVTWRYTKENGA